MKHLLNFFKNSLINYWHFVLIAVVIFNAVYQSFTLKSVYATVRCEKPVWVTFAISEPSFHNASPKKLSAIIFSGEQKFSDSTLIQHNKFSAWYKIRFDEIPMNISLDFFQYETVTGYDISGNIFPGTIFESDVNKINHKRHVVFDLNQTNQPQQFYFKVFSRKQQDSDSLQIKVLDTTILHNRIADEFYRNQNIAFLIFLVFGICVFQLIYIGSLAWSRRKPEYYYYWAFVFVSTFYFLISRRFELGYLGEWQHWITSSILLYFAVLNCLYCRFIRFYLDTRTTDPFTDRQYRMAEWFMFSGVIMNGLIYLYSGDLEYTFSFFIPFTKTIVVLDVYLLSLLFRQKDILVRYPLIGVACIVGFTGTGLLYSYLHHLGFFTEVRDFDTYGTLTGVVVDAVCLNLGLNYKHRLDIIEKQKAVEVLRHKFAADLHDDIGSSLSSISLLNQRIKAALIKGNSEEVELFLNRIALNVQTSIDNTRTIAWALDDRNAKLNHLIGLIKEFSRTLDSVQKFQWQTPDTKQTETIDLTPELKKNLYLIFKESVNNAIKHAQSEIIAIDISIDRNNIFSMKIQDFGCGFERTTNTRNSGLHNIEKRASSLNGIANITSELNKGTTILVIVPLNG